ncbi:MULTISPECIES: 5-(carboxyamino)imidazole ribonucleotide synthase [Halolamina]|uniref:N5-carboxyaminoimidazole ribonucleotide synthase n=1 Tax=Halolamina pelagica TaxID=699431 RepID=A0A1I5NQ26_9EURY|nr:MULTISPECIES: 5-(carboxyamino)imidazole ribonucleotide synthase [Halolamina]NHX36406.1 5-(carboxyamino)imidazole ribonucleotide synthase [Halolamina sp. R1-12]SFP23406.1 5-(carboxyamino)imidazole ribonucleotide synthase [Halolamina pelagica]
MSVTLPGPTLGVVGGGQLGRMLGEAASPLGVDVVVLDATPDCPAARVADQIEGDLDDPEAVRELAERADVLTFEIETADPELLAEVRAETGTPVHPDPETLGVTGDKLREKEMLADAGIPVPEFAPADTPAAAETAVDRFGSTMLKAREGGYDGRGNEPVTDADAAAGTLETVGGDAVAEELLDFDRELAAIGVRGADDETRVFPVTETIHREEILRGTVSPPRVDDETRERGRDVVEQVLAELDGRGVFGVELFDVDGEILVNEIAPRPHNSGHWTIEGAATSQFEQHVRAVLGWPLGPVERVAPTASANVLGDVDAPEPATLSGVDAVLAEPDASLHWYGKREARSLRKMGHLTVTDPGAADARSALETAESLRGSLTFTE